MTTHSLSSINGILLEDVLAEAKSMGLDAAELLEQRLTESGVIVLKRGHLTEHSCGYWHIDARGAA
jgi:hypothetical protein